MGVMDTGVVGPPATLTVLLFVAPLLACARLGARHTALVCGGAAALALGADVAFGRPSLLDLVARAGALLLGGGITVYAAHRRTELESALTRAREVTRITQGVIQQPISRSLCGTHVRTRHHCAARESTVGGDLYDVAVTPYGLRVLVGDVRGHGLEALRLTAATITGFRELAYTQPSLPELVTGLDSRLAAELGPEDFVTVVLAEFAPGEVRLVNCGHPAPLRAGHRVELLEPFTPTTPLGLGPEPRQCRVRLQPGDRLLIYTDGLSEVRAPDGSTFPLLAEASRALREPLPEDALNHLYDRAIAHGGTPPCDDLTLMLCQPTEATMPTRAAVT